ncbi:MAG: CDP-diacylglycerol--serine O-phosphatidyltransferase [Deltaproteobacteria bacterium]|nr:CDP-diacylglycerol--serine O-phosphatidyltransferase [Deltaproteobacteria bacterium]
MTTRQLSSPQRPARFSMLRSYQASDLLTLANAFAGTASILIMMSYVVTRENWRVTTAFGALSAALIFDFVDGKVARWRQKQSLFGQELDSLADIVSFGVAPVVVAYGLGMDGGLDALILVFFVGCGVSRLARFNITAAQLSDPKGKVKYFEGMPIPSSMLLILVLAICFYTGQVGDNLPLGTVEIASLEWHPLSLLYLANGSGMISKRLRIPKP